MTRDEREKIDLAIQTIDKIDWRWNTVDVIKARVDTARSILAHVTFWQPLKKKRKKDERSENH